MQNNQFHLALAEYKSIAAYKPRISDFVIWHGWLSHYYGIINGIENNQIRIIKAGIPLLLLSMEQDQMDQNAIVVSLNKIKSSRGAYAIQQAGIWYI